MVFSAGQTHVSTGNATAHEVRPNPRPSPAMIGNARSDWSRAKMLIRDADISLAIP